MNNLEERNPVPEYDHTYPNSDRIQNVFAIYLAPEVEGELRPDSDEELELRYFATHALPEIPASSRRMLARDGSRGSRRTHPRRAPSSLRDAAASGDR